MKKLILLLSVFYFSNSYSQGIKISNLPQAETLTGVELLPVVQSGVTKKTTSLSIANLSPTYSADSLWRSSNGNLYPASSLNVGIGTSTPSGLFQVQGSHGYYLFNDAGKQTIQCFNGCDDYVSLYGGGSYADHFYQVTVGDQSYFQQFNNRFLFNSGSVGIGKSPDNNLSVNGNADFTGYVGVGTTTPTSTLELNGTNSFYTQLGVDSFKNYTGTNFFGLGINGTFIGREISGGHSGFYSANLDGLASNIQGLSGAGIWNPLGGINATYRLLRYISP